MASILLVGGQSVRRNCDDDGVDGTIVVSKADARHVDPSLRQEAVGEGKRSSRLSDINFPSLVKTQPTPCGGNGVLQSAL